MWFCRCLVWVLKLNLKDNIVNTRIEKKKKKNETQVEFRKYLVTVDVVLIRPCALKDLNMNEI